MFISRTANQLKKYVNFNHQLIEQKLKFVKLQKEKFLQEHSLKMEIMEITLKIKKRN